MAFFGSQIRHCNHCGGTDKQDYTIENPTGVYQVPVCSACGILLVPSGLPLRDEELSNMFEKSMNISNMRETAAEASPLSQTSSLGYSSSQHYHHSAHVVSKSTETDIQKKKSEKTAEAHRLLIDRNINPDYMPAAQRDLFEEANPEQREELIKLWSVAPIEQIPAKDVKGWKESALGTAGEEELSGLLYEQRISRNSRVSSPSTIASGNVAFEDQHLVEPYMDSGYEYLASRDLFRDTESLTKRKDNYRPLGAAVEYQQALDPAFSGREWWRDFVDQQPMELQYGMFEQMSQYLPSGPAGTKEDEEML